MNIVAVSFKSATSLIIPVFLFFQRNHYNNTPIVVILRCKYIFKNISWFVFNFLYLFYILLSHFSIMIIKRLSFIFLLNFVMVRLLQKLNPIALNNLFCVPLVSLFIMYLVFLIFYSFFKLINNNEQQSSDFFNILF